MAQQSAGAPAILLIVSGVLGLLYSLFYALWTAWPLLMGILLVISNISEKGLTGDAVTIGLLSISMPLVQMILFALCVATSIVTLFGGVRFLQFRSKGLVWLGIICSVTTPLIGAAANSASMFNCGTCGVGLFGCMLGNIGTAPLFIVGLVATVVGAVMVSNPRYAEAFEENAG